MTAIVNYLDSLLITASSYPLIIQIAIYATVFNVLFAIGLFINMLRLRRKRKKLERRLENVLINTEDLFLDILLCENEILPYEIIERYEQNVEKLSQDSMQSVVVALENIILGNRELRNSINFNSIVDSFDVLNHLEKNIDVRSTKKRLTVLQTLSNLELTISDSRILPQTYSTDSEVKKSSRASYLGVSNNQPFQFFDSKLEMPLNEWDQIALMQQFEVHHRDALPDFSRWIKYSKQDSQIIFFTRMIAHFQQYTSVEIVCDLLDNSNKEIRKEAILALGKLNYTAIEPKLINMFNHEPVGCQKAIIHTITMFQTGEAYDFLVATYEETGSVDNRILVAEALYLYGPRGAKFIKEKVDLEEGFNKVILMHVQNPLIQSELKSALDKADERYKLAPKKKPAVREEVVLRALQRA